MVDFYLASMLVFILLLLGFFWYDRKNVERQSIIFLRKTERGKRFLTNLGRRFPRLWWVYGNMAVTVGFAASVFISVFLFITLSQSLVADTQAPLALVLPSPTSELVQGPGFFGVPFWYWIISIFLLILVHEGSHGIMAARERVRIKHLGWGALAVIPLAFVEPDEKQLQKEKTTKQLRVFAAGSFGNFMLAGLAAAIILSSLPAFYEPAGVGFSGFMEGLPAQEANLTGRIIGIDGQEISDLGDLSAKLDEVGPGKTISIRTIVETESGPEERLFTLTTEEDPSGQSEGGYIGIAGVYTSWELREGVAAPGLMAFLFGRSPNFMGLFSFLYLINFGVGMFNLLPLGPLDGGRMWRLVLDRVIPRRSKQVMNGVSWVFLLLIILLFTSAFI